MCMPNETHRRRKVRELTREGFDRTDMFKAKKVLGDNACIAGNVPASLLVTGTPWR